MEVLRTLQSSLLESAPHLHGVRPAVGRIQTEIFAGLRSLMVEGQMLGEALGSLLEHGVVINRHTCPKIAGGVVATLLLYILPVGWGVKGRVANDGVVHRGGYLGRHLGELGEVWWRLVR